MALIPPTFLDCVVAIGIDDKKGNKRWIASGFLYGHFIRKIDDKTNKYQIFLLMNRHVLENKDLVYLRFNPIGNAPAKEFSLYISTVRKSGTYKNHPDDEIDLACILVLPNVLKEQGIQFNYFRSDIEVANKKILEDFGFSEGDAGYILGFPMGIVGGERNYVIVRHGTIARLGSYLSGAAKEILMDCLIFPGNSGGPVITRPEFTAIVGTKSQKASYLIGLVAGYIPYQDIAISEQTKRPRVVFEDNSGLAAVIPIQYAIDLINEMIKSNQELKDKTSK